MVAWTNSRKTNGGPLSFGETGHQELATSYLSSRPEEPPERLHFLKHFRWLPIHENEICRAFETRGSSLVKNYMNKIRHNKCKGNWLRDDVLQQLRDYWTTDEKFQHRSLVAKKNRAVDGGAPLYTGGSVSIPAHHKRLTIEKKRPPTTYEVVEKTKRKKDGVWVGKAKSVADEFHRLREEATSQGQEQSAASDNTLFLELVGGKNKKGQVYGLGRMGDDYLASSMRQFQSDPDLGPDVREVIANLNAELAAKDYRIDSLEGKLDDTQRQIRELFQHLGYEPSCSRAVHNDDSDDDDDGYDEAVGEADGEVDGS